MKRTSALLFLLIILNLFQHLSLFAQFPPEKQEYADSLWQVWNDKSQPDTSRLKAMYKIAWNGYLYSQPDSTFYFAQLQYKFAKEKELRKYMAIALYTQGVSFQIQSDYTKAINYYTRSLTIYEEILKHSGNPDNKAYREAQRSIASILGNIGGIYKNQGDYTKAIDYFTRCLTIQEKIGYKKGIALSLGNIGGIYGNQGDYAKALDYCTRSLTIKEEIEDKQGIAYALNSIGVIYYNQASEGKSRTEGRELYAKALDYYTRSLTIHEKSGDKKGIAASFNNIGIIYAKQASARLPDGQEEKSSTESRELYAKAIDYFTRSLTMREEIGDKYGISMSLGNIGNIYYELKQYSKAIDYNTRALAIAQEVGAAKETRNAANALYDIYKATGKPALALENYELYITMHDSILSEESQKEVMRQEFKYNYEKKKALADKEHELELQRQEEVAAVEQKKQNIIIGSVGGGLGLVVLFSIFLFKRFRVTQRQKAVIEEKNKEITDSITYAKRIQEAILPPTKLVKENLENSFILYKPKDIVAGDFYWMEPQGANIIFAAADCTGHGVPGAMVSVVCHNALNRSVREFGLTNPAKILDKTRELVIATFERSDEEVKDGMDIALCNLNTKTNELQFAGASNGLVIIKAGTTEFEDVQQIKADKQPIGLYAKPKPFTSHTIQLERGDTFYIFSDGYPDQFGGPKGKKLMYKPFRRLLLKNHHKPMDEQRQLLNKTIEDWKGNLEQVDDICIIGVRV